jgi:hypothetical protein
VHARAKRDAVRRGSRWGRWPLLPLALASGSLGGCAGWWDEVSSRDFHFKQLWEKAPDPLQVARTATDGDKKAKALRALREPLANGGSQQEQDVIVKLLVGCATSDPQPWCRLAAVDTLRHFRDPRAAEGLKDAYYRADCFAPETATPLKCAVLGALGDTGNPAAVELLVRVLREPPVEGSEVEKQQKMDERIAAAIALGHFRGQSPAAEALLGVLRSDKDVALRYRANESLVQITGRDLPADAQAWDDLLHKGKTDAVAERPLSEKFLRLISLNP